MAISNNPLSSMSYTNKDFRAIFTELLDLTRKLTYKWDPSISNESDPGVILLKLDAIIGDKNNYNIDKNILEAFPETVTQEVCARNMYKQLAYIMPWYQSATTSVSFKWIGEALEPGETVTIPAFTMITDSETSKIYTLIEDVQFTYGTSVSTGKVMQGTITELVVNGSSTLKLDNMDYNNRIYLNDYNVAENGIFITNAEESSSGFWEKVDNLQIEPIGNRYYEFGVDSRNNSTYVEFPSDIETLIRAGLNIKYLISDGLSGNVNSNELIKFYEDVTIEFRGEELNLNEEVIQMYNPSATTNGADPEPVSQAYNSYRRVAGTFDTLVTLRDYINAIYLSGYVSNDLVSDRLTDIQSSYKIVTDSYGSGDSIIEYARTQNEDSNDLTPYDLKLYLLHNGGIINSISTFNSTFDMEPSQGDIAKQVESYIQSTRCMQHNFQDILPDIPCMFRNIYPIKIKFVPQYQLSQIQIDSVKRNIIQSLYDTLNSRQINFGEEPDYNLIYDAVMNSDERIKIITIDDFYYTTYATYWDSDLQQFKSIPISAFDNDPWIITVSSKNDIPSAIKTITNPSQYLFIVNSPEDVEENNKVYKYNVSKQIAEEYSDMIDTFRVNIITKAVLAGVTPLYNQETSFSYSIDQIFDHVDTDVERVSTDLVISPWGFDSNGGPKAYDKSTSETIQEYTLKDNESLQFLAPSFVTDMSYSNYVKFELVLGSPSSGDLEYRLANSYNYSKSEGTYDGHTTTLYVALRTGGYAPYVNLNDTTHDSNYNYIEPDEEGNGGRAGSVAWFNNTPIEVEGNSGSTITMSSSVEAWYREYITLYTQEQVYRIASDTDYKLKYGDSITFFWKETDEDTAPYQYRCYKGLQYETDTERSPIIRGTFTINGNGKSNCIINPDTLTSSGTIPYDVNPYSNYQKIYSMYGDYTLSGTKSIDTRILNQAELKANDRYYYFITNEIDEDTQQYQMKFDAVPIFVPNKYYSRSGNIYTPIENEPANWGFNSVTYYESNGSGGYTAINFKYDYTLKTDEYFIYTNRNMTEYELLGTGTLIRLEENPFGDSLPIFKVDVVAYEDVAMLGLESFTDKTKLLSVNALVKEQQIYNLTGGDSISIEIDKEKYEGTPYSMVKRTQSSSGDITTETISGLAFPYFSTTQANSVIGYDVQYSTGDAGFQPLPGIEIDDETSNWSGTAILNIDATYDEAQIIDNSLPNGAQNNEQKKSLQQLIVRRLVEDSDGSEENQIVNQFYPVDPFSEDSEINVLTNVSLTKVGGINIDVTYLDAYGERTNINLFAFELNPAFSSEPLFSKTPEYGIRMNFKTTGLGTLPNISVSTSGSNTIFTISNIKLETGFNYILGIRNTSQSRKFWLAYSNNNYVECLNTTSNSKDGNVASKGLSNGKYYFLLDNINRDITSLQIIIDGEDEQGFLEFDNLTKCVPNELFELNYGISPSNIEELLPIYDYEGLFKYNYQVPNDVLIEDPLSAKTFFNENHPCNRFTIGHVNLLIPTDSQANSKASSIDVMNNGR